MLILVSGSVCMLRGFLGRIGSLGPSFRALLFSGTLTLLAGMVGHVVIAWWIAQQGGGADLALYAVIIAISTLVFLPLLSPLGDRYCKRSLMTIGLAGQMVGAAGLAVLAQWSAYHLPLIIGLDLVGTAGACLFAPAGDSIIAELLPADQLTAGLGFQRSGQALGRLAGPTLGGAALALGTTATALWLYTLLLGISCALTLRIPKRPVSRPATTGAAAWLADIKAGLAAKWHIKIERWWTLVTFLFAIFLFPCIGLLLPVKIQALGLSSTWLGLCEASLSAGMLVGALGLSARLAERVGRFAIYTSAIVGMGICFAIVGASHRPLVLLVVFAVCGLCVATTQLVGRTHRMLAIPPSFLARMTSVHFMVMQVAATIGPAVGGIGLARLGVDRTYVLFGGAMLLSGVGYMLAPGYRAFIGLSHDQATGYYGRTYPELFEPRKRG
jgi:MFS family permease